MTVLDLTVREFLELCLKHKLHFTHNWVQSNARDLQKKEDKSK